MNVLINVIIAHVTFLVSMSICASLTIRNITCHSWVKKLTTNLASHGSKSRLFGKDKSRKDAYKNLLKNRSLPALAKVLNDTCQNGIKQQPACRLCDYYVRINEINIRSQ